MVAQLAKTMLFFFVTERSRNYKIGLISRTHFPIFGSGWRSREWIK
jgi:hypothetical protein